MRSIRSKHKVFSLFLTLALLVGLLPWTVMPARAASVASNSTTWSENMTVDSDVTIEDRVTVSGNVTLTLNATLTATKGITVNEGSNLTITGTGTLYAGRTAGSETVLTPNNAAGIGGSAYGYATGTIIISSGTVYAVAGWGSAGIGNGQGGVGGTITVNGGTVNAKGGKNGGDGIGGSGSQITINGGSVTAVGESNGAGIGGKDSSTTITDGTVNATGGNLGAGIGGGSRAATAVNISGGTVTAQGGSSGAAGIGNSGAWSGGTISISGGNVTATGGGSGSAGIGGSGSGTVDSITLSGGTISATSGGTNTAGIGNGRYAASETTAQVTGAVTLSANNIKSMEVTGTGSITVPAGGTLSIASGGTLTVDSDGSVTVASGGTLTNNGTVTNSGTMTNSGTFNGTEPVGDGDKTGFKPTLTITAKAKTITYGDAPAGNGVTYSGFETGDSETSGVLSGTLAYDFNYSQYGNVGSYTITPKGLTSTKYNLSFVAGTLTVNRAAATVKANDASKTYGESNPASFTAAVSELKGSDAASVISYSVSRAAGENAGTYAITPSGNATQGNYTVTYTPGTFTINPKSIANAAIGGIPGQTYKGSAVTPTVAVADGDTALTQGTDYTVSYSDNTNAGTDTATVTVTGMGNYTGSKTARFTILPATVTVTAKDRSAYIGGTAPDLSNPVKGTDYTVTGLVGNDTLGGMLTMKYQQNGADATPDMSKAGEYDIVVSGATAPTGGNYENAVTFVAGKLTITVKPASSASSGGGSSGGGSSGGSSSSSGSDYTPSTPSSTTTTTNNPDGSTTRTTTNADGSRTAVTTTADGCTATVKTDRSGNVVSVAFSVSQKAAEEAQRTGAPIQLPAEIAPVTPQNAATAAAVAITVPNAFIGGGAARVEIEVIRSGPGVIAMLRGANGGLTPVKECYEGSVILPVTESCEIVIVDNTKQFSDVKANDWFYDNVTFVTAREIFNGTGDGLFTPNASMTRGMLAQALYNFDRSAAPNESYAFADARGKWYAGAASWAASVGIVTGTDEGFDGEANVTREAVATMLYRYAKAQGYDVAARADLSAFADAASVSDWALEAMQWAVGAGLVNGMDGFLAPQAPATRAQLAAIIERFVENVVR